MSLQAKRISADDYLFAVSCLRAREVRRMTSDQLARMIDARDFDEAFRMLSEHGYDLSYDRDGQADVEATLTSLSANELRMCAEMIPDPHLLDFLRYPYDAHNLKSALKAEVRGEGTEDLLIDLGTVDSGSVQELALARNFDLFPENMRLSAPKAIEAYAKSRDPRLIDVILDRACYADVAAECRKFGLAYCEKLMEIKIDLTNVLTAIRLIRMNAFEDTDAMNDYFIAGGTLDAPFFSVCVNGEDALLAALSSTEYAFLPSIPANERQRLSDLDRICEDHYMEKARDAKNVSYGPEPVCAYLIALEYEIKNVRIILSAKRAGLDRQSIEKRLRQSYV